MTDREALHAAARRYCMDRASLWRERYAAMASAGDDPKSVATHPRYNVLEAILLEVERSVPDDFSAVLEAREFLVAAGSKARTAFTEPPQETVAIQSMSEERDLFREYIERLSEQDLRRIEPLPYRRTLGSDESKALWERLNARWQAGDGYWHPLCLREPPPGVIAFPADAFHEEVTLSCLYAILGGQGITRVWELREYGPEHELDLESLEPFYDGAEGYWTAGDMSWLIYASHENSITFAGQWLVAAIKEVWPEWARRLYTGWYSR